MSKEHKNPYRDGTAYAKIFDAIRKAKNQTVTRQGLIEQGFSAHDITVVLSPREVGTSRGSPAGNFSAQGELYFMLPKKVKATVKKIDGEMTKVAGQPKTFSLRWRKEALEPHCRPVSEKVAKAKKSAKAKAPKGETKIEKVEKTRKVTVADKTAEVPPVNAVTEPADVPAQA